MNGATIVLANDCENCCAGRIQLAQSSLHQEGDKLLAAAREGSMEGVQTTVRAIADWVHHLSGHCNVTLVNDALRNLCTALEDSVCKSSLPACISGYV